MIQSLLNLFLNHHFFQLLVSNSLIFQHPFSLGTLFNNSILKFHVFHRFLSLELFIVLVDSLVLPEMSVFLTSVIVVVVLVFEILDICLHLIKFAS